MLAKNFRLKIHLGDSITDLEAGKGRERRKKKKFYSSVMTWSWLSRDRIKHPMQKSMPGRGDAPSQESGRTIWHLQIIHVVLTASGATATVWNAHNTVSTWQVLTDFFFLGACEWRPSCLQTANLFTSPLGTSPSMKHNYITLMEHWAGGRAFWIDWTFPSVS